MSGDAARPSDVKDFPEEEFRSRWERAWQLMERDRLDAIVITEQQNYRYFSGHRTRQFGNKMRPMMVLLPRGAPPTLMIYGREVPVARAQTYIGDIRSYVDVPFPPQLVIDTIEDLGLGRGTIGWELGADQRMWLPFRDHERIREGLPQARFADASAAITRCRLIKSAAEVARIREACRLTVLAYELILQRVHPGLNVAQVERICLEALADAGADAASPGFASFGAGVRADHVYRPGELFHLDFGAVHRGYRADITRRATFGPASDAHQRDHERIVAIEDKVIAALRPGERARAAAEVFNREMARLRQPALEGSKRIGHGIGLDLQEPPSLNVVDDTVLEPGIVVTPEPRYLRDGELVMVEETVVVTAAGAERLSDAGGYERLREMVV